MCGRFVDKIHLFFNYLRQSIILICNTRYIGDLIDIFIESINIQATFTLKQSVFLNIIDQCHLVWKHTSSKILVKGFLLLVSSLLVAGKLIFIFNNMLLYQDISP